MDPNETLRLIRVMTARLNANEFEVDSDDAMALVELVESLDKWITNGGFLPDAWRVKC